MIISRQFKHMFKVTHEIFSETNIIKILAFLIATYLLCYVGVFCNRQSGIHVGTKCAFLSDVFPYSRKADLMQGF